MLSNKPPKPWLLIAGPTAVGKSAFLLKLHQHYPSIELISADAFQVYRGFDIGTAKPPREIRSLFPHHLIDICEPHESFNVARFCETARDLGQEVINRQGIPVISGGTAFYFKHLLLGLPESPPVDQKIRNMVLELISTHSRESIWDYLGKLDPARQKQLHPNDSYRIQRAIEIALQQHDSLDSMASTGRGWALNNSKHPHLLVVLNRERADLRDRIAFRIEEMFTQGLEEEWESLTKRGYGIDSPAMKAIGYKEFFLGLKVPELKERIFYNSVQYAKRQVTFFKSLPNAQHFNADDFDGIIDAIHGLTQG